METNMKDDHMETEPYFYWKKEKKMDKWKVLQDVPGALEGAVESGAMFRTWMSFSKPYTNSGSPEPIRYGDLPLDFDDAENPQNALQDMRDLCLVHLPEFYGIDPYEIEFFLSGGKGFHAVIPQQCLGAGDGDTHLPLIYKRMVSQWIAAYELKALDPKIYDMKRGHMFRIANVKRDNGKHKVPLTLEEVQDFPYSDLIKLGDEPRMVDAPVEKWELEQVDDLAEAFTRAKTQFHRELEDAAKTPTVKLSENDIKALSKNIPPCVKHIIAKMPKKSEGLNFNRLILNLAKYFLTAGYDTERAYGTVSKFLERYPHSDTYDTTEKRVRHWKELWFYLSGHDDAEFKCSYIKGMGLPGTAFECRTCLEKQNAVPGLSQKDVIDCVYSNEDGDARIFQNLYKDRYIYDHGAALWNTWGGHYWQEDETDEAFKAVDGVIGVYDHAAAIEKAKSKDESLKEEVREKHEKNYGELKKRIFTLKSGHRKRNVLWCAGIGAGLTGREWDKDPWKLACKNGVLDLKEGELLPGKQSDYIKTATEIEYSDDAKCPKWEQFLKEIFDHDDDLINYVKRLFGYGITGLKQEHVLPVLWGAGRNGKGTFLETIKEVLGKLAHKTKAESLMDNGKLKASGTADADTIAFMGKRIIWASETNEGGRMNVGRIKELVGGDTLNARAPYARRSVEFDPSHLLCLITNAKPYAPASDFALWERVALIPFTLSFVEDPKAEHERKVNKRLPDELKKELPGILTWLVMGCIEWHIIGLSPPEIVRSATTRYQKENDLIGDFISECCEVDPNAEAPAAKLYGSYKVWAESMGYKPISGVRFGKEVATRFEKITRRKRAFYTGVSLSESDTQEQGHHQKDLDPSEFDVFDEKQGWE
jgi:putative DNA primase/helicase